MPRSGRALGGLHVKDSVLGRQFFLHLLSSDALAICRARRLHFATVGLTQRFPALAELARCRHQDFVSGRSQICYGGLHGPGAGRGEHHHVILRTHKSLEIGQNFAVKGAKLGRAMVHGCAGHGELRRG